MITARRRVGIERVRGNCMIMSFSQTSWNPIKYVEVFIYIIWYKGCSLNPSFHGEEWYQDCLRSFVLHLPTISHQRSSTRRFFSFHRDATSLTACLFWSSLVKMLLRGGEYYTIGADGRGNITNATQVFVTRANCRQHLSKSFFVVHNWNSTMHHKMLSHYTAFVRQDLIAPMVHRCHTNGPNWSQQSRCTECKTPPA